MDQDHRHLNHGQHHNYPSQQFPLEQGSSGEGFATWPNPDAHPNTYYDSHLNQHLDPNSYHLESSPFHPFEQHDGPFNGFPDPSHLSVDPRDQWYSNPPQNHGGAFYHHDDRTQFIPPKYVPTGRASPLNSQVLVSSHTPAPPSHRHLAPVSHLPGQHRELRPSQHHPHLVNRHLGFIPTSSPPSKPVRLPAEVRQQLTKQTQAGRTVSLPHRPVTLQHVVPELLEEQLTAGRAVTTEGRENKSSQGQPREQHRKPRAEQGRTVFRGNYEFVHEDPSKY
ncbi:uncharacterized protein JCM6883_004624 [Sporobolomyces salmoneus]|uniref:uncharacterized protein n=1 Tax=Sporobolomyces salmoneus TaxID=183962 RepID=UPI0031776EB1